MPTRRSVLPFLAAAALYAGDGDANLTLTLGAAVGETADKLNDFEFEIPVRGGQWATSAWGYGRGRGHSRATVAVAEGKAGERILTINAAVAADNWIRGGKGEYTVTLKPAEGGGWSGSYTGSFQISGPVGYPYPDIRTKPMPLPAAPADGEKLTVAGAVTVRNGVAWPGLVPGYVAPTAGEHPRLCWRAADKPRILKLLTTTPQGQAMVARAQQIAGLPCKNQFSHQDDGIEEGSDKASTWPAVGFGFLWQVTGDRTHLERAKQIVNDTILKNPAGRRGKAISQDIHHAPRLTGLAVAYDLCADGWDADFNRQVVDEITTRVVECATGKFEGKGMSGYNANMWSNHNGIRCAGTAIGALAINGDTGSAGPVDASFYIDLSAREVRAQYEIGFGESGWYMEGGWYKHMTIARGYGHAFAAYRNARGLVVDPGNRAENLLIHDLITARPGAQPKVQDVTWATLLGTISERWLPGVMAIHDRSVGLKGDKGFAIGYGLLAPFAVATYPWEVTPVEGQLPWLLPDTVKGHWVMRTGYKNGADDLVLVHHQKSQPMGGCHSERAGSVSTMELWGFGKQWLAGHFQVAANNGILPSDDTGPVTTAWRQVGDRALVIDADTSRAYFQDVDTKAIPDKAAHLAKAGGVGWVKIPNWREMLDLGIRGKRSLAVDVSGTSGAPMLIASYDAVVLPAGFVARGSPPRRNFQSALNTHGEEASTKSVATPSAAGSDPTADAEQAAAIAKLPPHLRALAEKNAAAQPAAGAKIPGKRQLTGPTTWELPITAAAGAVRWEGNRFTVGDPAAEHIAGILIGENITPVPGVCAADGPGTYLAVMTFQRGPAPAMTVENGIVTVGKRRLKIDGGALVLE